ncbi:hypothetical protein H0178_51305 [Cytobacillus firmus]|nr:hypothetical protein [Cytobacillus firmus]VTR40167.1 Uncharacterised protein [Actinobacillus pleuropneumoniae]
MQSNKSLGSECKVSRAEDRSGRVVGGNLAMGKNLAKQRRVSDEGLRIGWVWISKV